MTQKAKWIALPLFSLLLTACGGGGSGSLIHRAYGAEGAAGQPINLAVKYVEYTDSAGRPILDQPGVDKVTQTMNALYATCGVQFRTEETVNIDPATVGLAFNLSSMGELEQVRSKFQDDTKLLIVNTGDWDHSSMGSANAWTTMPGEQYAGAVIEGQVSSFANIIAHEIGHYLSLDHVSDTSNLMNPVIYDDSKILDTVQCEDVRKTATGIWSRAVRA